MSETVSPLPRDTTIPRRRLRRVAKRTRSPETRIDLVELADRYHRMAAHAARRLGPPH